MKNNADYLRGLFTGLVIFSIVLILAVFAWKWLYPIPYQNPPRSVQPASSPVDLGELTARVENLENDQAYTLRNLEWQLDQKILILGWLALAISVVAGFMGVKTYNDLDKVIRQKVNTTLENELYQLDPANLTVRLPKGHPDTPLIRKRLELSGLHNLTDYLELNKQCLRGLTLVPVNNPEEELRFRIFLAQEKPDPKLAAFVLYTTDPKFRVSVPDTLNQYERVATANMPATVITAALAISRGLHREK